MGRIADAICEHARRLPDVLYARDAIETKLAAMEAALEQHRVEPLVAFYAALTLLDVGRHHRTPPRRYTPT
ncbi:hypothetical protein ABZ863_05085 [Saccharomonospora sp. NPDC046836]|uniref:hypothetical protein n=1 Tax=Saccharomonospora sp. NPDC046836 TaxID=3156921 RepID=UPI0033C6F87D